MSEIDLAAAVIDQAVFDAANGPLTPTKPGQNELIDAVAAWVGVGPVQLFDLIAQHAKQRELAGEYRRNSTMRVVTDQTRLKISQARARYEARKHLPVTQQ